MQAFVQLDLWYYDGMVIWKLREYLDARNVSAYALAKVADTSPTTIYALARGTHERVSLEVLDKVLVALEHLTGEPAEVGDLLERKLVSETDTDDQAALLASGLSGLAEALDDLERDIPPEELAAWHDAFEGERVTE